MGLGESSHGSKEMTVFKTAFVQYLMQHTDYRVLVMEDHFAACAQLNHYLSTGEGDFEALYRNLMGVWKTPEFKDLLLWMRHYNAKQQTEKGKVFLYGADMQSASGLPLIKAYISSHKNSGSNIPEVDFNLLEKLNSREFDIRKQPK